MALHPETRRKLEKNSMQTIEASTDEVLQSQIDRDLAEHMASLNADREAELERLLALGEQPNSPPPQSTTVAQATENPGDLLASALQAPPTQEQPAQAQTTRRQPAQSQSEQSQLNIDVQFTQPSSEQFQNQVATTAMLKMAEKLYIRYGRKPSEQEVADFKNSFDRATDVLVGLSGKENTENNRAVFAQAGLRIAEIHLNQESTESIQNYTASLADVALSFDNAINTNFSREFYQSEAIARIQAFQNISSALDKYTEKPEGQLLFGFSKKPEDRLSPVELAGIMTQHIVHHAHSHAEELQQSGIAQSVSKDYLATMMINTYSNSISADINSPQRLSVALKGIINIKQAKQITEGTPVNLDDVVEVFQANKIQLMRNEINQVAGLQHQAQRNESNNSPSNF